MQKKSSADEKNTPKHKEQQKYPSSAPSGWLLAIFKALNLQDLCFTRDFLTCILSKLVHRLQINDVGRELAVHLSQDHAPPGVPLLHVLDVVANGGAVRSPAPVLVQPLPDHHPGHVLRRVPQPVDGHQQPRSRTGHFRRGACQSAGTRRNTGFRANQGKKIKIKIKAWISDESGSSPPQLRSHRQLCRSHGPQVTDCWELSTSPEKRSVVGPHVLSEAAGADDAISGAPDQQQVRRKFSLDKRGAETLISK